MKYLVACRTGDGGERFRIEEKKISVFLSKWFAFNFYSSELISLFVVFIPQFYLTDPFFA